MTKIELQTKSGTSESGGEVQPKTEAKKVIQCMVPYEDAEGKKIIGKIDLREGAYEIVEEYARREGMAVDKYLRIVLEDSKRLGKKVKEGTLYYLLYKGKNSKLIRIKPIILREATYEIVEKYAHRGGMTVYEYLHDTLTDSGKSKKDVVWLEEKIEEWTEIENQPADI